MPWHLSIPFVAAKTKRKNVQAGNENKAARAFYEAP
ncbi:hypothetical protein QG37_04293 [Candidozyma auris]|nr:hypothetical protein QG37_04293 [[Candida] auris]